MRAKMDGVLKELYREFGWKSRLAAAVGGPYVHRCVRREERRLAKGWTYEPPTFYEHNRAAAELRGTPVDPRVAHPVMCRVAPPAAERSGAAREEALPV